MKTISYSSYQNDGIIIDLEVPVKFNQYHLPTATNIPYEKLLFNHKEYLKKNQKYYLYCTKGRKSKKACEILEYYGYDVTQITK